MSLSVQSHLLLFMHRLDHNKSSSSCKFKNLILQPIINILFFDLSKYLINSHHQSHSPLKKCRMGTQRTEHWQSKSRGQLCLLSPARKKTWGGPRQLLCQPTYIVLSQNGWWLLDCCCVACIRQLCLEADTADKDMLVQSRWFKSRGYSCKSGLRCKGNTCSEDIMVW